MPFQRVTIDYGDNQVIDVEVITDFNDYERFKLKSIAQFGIVDISLLEGDEGNQLIEYVLLLDSIMRKGVIIFYPQNENIEYVTKELQSDKLFYICFEDDVAQLSEQFNCRFPVKYFIDCCELEDFTEPYKLDVKDEEVTDGDDDLSSFIKELPRIFEEAYCAAKWLKEQKSNEVYIKMKNDEEKHRQRLQRDKERRMLRRSKKQATQQAQQPTLAQPGPIQSASEKQKEEVEIEITLETTPQSEKKSKRTRSPIKERSARHAAAQAFDMAPGKQTDFSGAEKDEAMRIARERGAKYAILTSESMSALVGQGFKNIKPLASNQKLNVISAREEPGKKPQDSVVLELEK